MNFSIKSNFSLSKSDNSLAKNGEMEGSGQGQAYGLAAKCRITIVVISRCLGRYEFHLMETDLLQELLIIQGLI
jgi:hypothetical protein